MSEEVKTHYRKVFKSDHLGVADLEDLLEENPNKKLVFKIKEVKQEINKMVAGHRGNFNIAYFHEDIKPWVINATNGRVMRKFNENSPFVEHWSDTLVELYIDPDVKLKGEIVGGVKLRKVQPAKTKPELTEQDEALWFRAITALKDGKELDVILSRFVISEENQAKLLAESKL